MAHGSQQLRLFRRALHLDGKSIEAAAELAGMDLIEARLWADEDALTPPPAEAFELLYDPAQEERRATGFLSRDGTAPDTHLTPCRGEMEMSEYDPDTGEVLETRAADGGQRYPAASTLSDLIMMLKDGQFNADSTEPLQEFATKLEAAGIDGSKKVKGKIALTIEVEFDPSREFSVLTPSLKMTLPVEKHGATVAWFTADGRLSPNKPRQGNLFGNIREISGDARIVREA